MRRIASAWQSMRDQLDLGINRVATARQAIRAKQQAFAAWRNQKALPLRVMGGSLWLVFGLATVLLRVLLQGKAGASLGLNLSSALTFFWGGVIGAAAAVAMVHANPRGMGQWLLNRVLRAKIVAAVAEIVESGDAEDLKALVTIPAAREALAFGVDDALLKVRRPGRRWRADLEQPLEMLLLLFMTYDDTEEKRRELCEHAASLLAPQAFGREWRRGALNVVARYGTAANVDWLLGRDGRGRDVDRDSGGKTLLVEAIEAGNAEVARCLVERGADRRRALASHELTPALVAHPEAMELLGQWRAEFEREELMSVLDAIPFEPPAPAPAAIEPPAPGEPAPAAQEEEVSAPAPTPAPATRSRARRL